MEIFLVRHGRTRANCKKQYCGWKETSLSAEGMEQAHKTGEYLSKQKISAIFSSDLSRAAKTAEIIGGKCGVVNSSSCLLREMNFGLWEGLTYDQIQKNFKEEFSSWINDPFRFNVPGGENLVDVYNRLKLFLNNLAKNKMQKHRIALVTHGGIIRAGLFYFLEMQEDDFWNIRVENGSLSLVEYEKVGFEVVYHNWTGHLNDK